MTCIEDLKLKYYDLMVQHALQQSSYLDVAKYYYKVWETPSIKEDVGGKGKVVCNPCSEYIYDLRNPPGSGTYCLLYSPRPAQQRAVGHASSCLCGFCPS